MKNAQAINDFDGRAAGSGRYRLNTRIERVTQTESLEEIEEVVRDLEPVWIAGAICPPSLEHQEIEDAAAHSQHGPESDLNLPSSVGEGETQLNRCVIASCHLPMLTPAYLR